MNYFKISLFSLILLSMNFSKLIPDAKAQLNTHHTLKRIETPQFQPIQSEENFIYLPMEFNQADATSKLKNLPVDRIISISLIYTQYRQSERFNQLSLNEARTAELFKQLPALKQNSDIQWYWIAQTGCADPESCKSFFHGFEIRLKSEAKLKEEKANEALLSFYTSIYNGQNTSDSAIIPIISESRKYVRICDTIFTESANSKNRIGSLRFYGETQKKNWIKSLNKLRIKENELTIVLNPQYKIVNSEDFNSDQLAILKVLLRKNLYYKTSRIEGKQVNTQFTFQLVKNRNNRITKVEIFGAPVNDEGHPFDLTAKPTEYKLTTKCWYKDTTDPLSHFDVHENVVYEVLERNPQWQKCLVTTDVTGSMTPYLGQFLAWHTLNLNKNTGNHDFVFFNDGDNMPDHKKRNGKTGGTYYINTSNFQELRSLITKSQNNGYGGGDIKENDIEAIIFGLKNNPEVSEVILIADNNAPPRDLDLLSQIDKPVHIILCGAQKGINLAYMNMARQNGGTLHTIEQDLNRLSELKDGESFSVNLETFKLHHNQIVKVKSTGK